MVIDLTPNLGLKKPAKEELAKDWATLQKIAEFNNNLVGGYGNISVIPYTPVVIGPLTPPSLGTGITAGAFGESWVFRDWVFGNFIIKFVDPGIAPGTGNGAYGIRLPYPIDPVYHDRTATSLNSPVGDYPAIGEGTYYDASSVATSGPCALDPCIFSGFSYVRPITESYTGKATSFIGPNIPAAVATGDAITGNFIYKRAV